MRPNRFAQRSEAILKQRIFQLAAILSALSLLCACGSALGMRTMDMALLELVQAEKITKDTALTYCTNYENMSRCLGVSK